MKDVLQYSCMSHVMVMNIWNSLKELIFVRYWRNDIICRF